MTRRTKRSLVVEDELPWQTRISKALERENFEVRVVSDYDEALAELRKRRFDLVTVDLEFYMGAEVDYVAADLLSDIRCEFGNIPCIIISGSPSSASPEEVVRLVKRYDIAGFIEKAKFNRDKLKKLIEEEAISHTKILFLAANPSGTTQLRLDQEVRAIDQAILQTEFRDNFDIEQHWAVRVTDLPGHLLRHKPHIVHFSGHGSESSEIILEDDLGNSHPVSAGALGLLFSVRKDNIRCVVLNACYSERQAQAIAQHIDCVIGMSKAIGDSTAISFARAFYQALGYGEHVKAAFDMGCAQIVLEGLDEHDKPKLLAIKSDPEDIFFA